MKRLHRQPYAACRARPLQDENLYIRTDVLCTIQHNINVLTCAHTVYTHTHTQDTYVGTRYLCKPSAHTQNICSAQVHTHTYVHLCILVLSSQR